MPSSQSTDKTWLQLVCSASKNHHESIEAAMESAGALSISWQDAEDEAVLEPLPGETPLWKNLIITALFDAQTDLSNLQAQLKAQQSAWEITSVHLETLHDQVWERVWMDNFHPMRFGDNLWIIPSNIDQAEIVKVQRNTAKPSTIILDPGLAFGTGTHPTTALCLEWLDQNPPHDLTLVDYGCGSGILALAAAKQGARHIIATDIDPQALTATKENMRRNNIDAEKIHCVLPNDCPQEAVDVVLANILCGPLIELYPTLSALVKPAGKIVISGLLETQKDDIIKAYSSQFSNFQLKQKQDWIRITASKKP